MIGSVSPHTVRSPWADLMSSAPVRAAAEDTRSAPPDSAVLSPNAAAAAPPIQTWAPAGKRIVLGVIAGLSMLAGAGCSQAPPGANIVEVHMDPAASFRKAHDMVVNARTSIKLEMFELQNKAVDGDRGATRADGYAEQQQLTQDLVAMHDRGRTVQVILDQSERASGVNNSEMKQYLESKGIQVEVYPADKVSLDHVKLLVVDGEEVLIGGVNWSSLFPKHHDADLSIKGPAAKDAETLFDADWKFAGTGSGPAPRVEGSDTIRFTTTAPCEQGGGSSDIRNQLLDAIPRTRSRFYVEMFTLNNEDVMKQLANLKAKGRDVRVILDKTEPSNQKAFDYLQANHVPVRWFKKVTKEQAKHDPALKGREGGWLHAKWGVQDAAFVEIGSANWTEQALDACGPRTDGSRPSKAHNRNHEINVGVHDARVGSTFEKQFLTDWDNATEG